MLRLLALFALLLVSSLPAAAQPTVEFAGYTWMVRTYGGGPGPNEWREANVRVDTEGLHLTIRRDGDQWTSAEVVMLGPPLGFGTYQFSVAGDLSVLDSNAVLGFFNFPRSEEVGPSGTNEIDIEFAQWGQPGNPNRLNWNIYPAVVGGGKGNHALPFPSLAESTHRWTWAPDSITYASFAGYFPEGDAPPIAEWTYRPDNPERDIPQVPLTVHINLWLVDGSAPAGGEPVAVTIRDFRFSRAGALQ